MNFGGGLFSNPIFYGAMHATSRFGLNLLTGFWRVGTSGQCRSLCDKKGLMSIFQCGKQNTINHPQAININGWFVYHPEMVGWILSCDLGFPYYLIIPAKTKTAFPASLSAKEHTSQCSVAVAQRKKRRLTRWQLKLACKECCCSVAVDFLWNPNDPMLGMQTVSPKNIADHTFFCIRTPQQAICQDFLMVLYNPINLGGGKSDHDLQRQRILRSSFPFKHLSEAGKL
jgi:hypothetical protein